MNWTDEQLQAISDRGSNILVSAAAGSGKTALLTERLSRLVLEDDVDVTKLLVVTFTRAASREMKERFRKKLYEALDQANRGEPGPMSAQEILRQIGRLDQAQISTMDAFCSRIVRSYFQLTGIDPAFRIAGETEASLMRTEACEEILEEMYDTGSEEQKCLSDLYGQNRSDQGLKDAIFKLMRFFETVPDVAQWEKNSLEALEGDLFETAPYRALADAVRADARTAASQIERAQQIWEEELPGSRAGKFLTDDLAYYRSFEAAVEPEDVFRNCMDKSGYTRAAYPRKNGLSPETKAEISAIRNANKDRLTKYSFLSGKIEDETEHVRKMQSVLSGLLELTRKVQERYEKKKADAVIADFSQVSKAALRVLENDEARAEITDRFDYIFFDEYQDTNDVQEAIITAIAKDDRRFMVGDLKQSIYRFRKAEPGIFIEKYDRYDTSDDGKLILLNRNFRSSKSVIDGVNAVFSRIMSRGLGDMDYDENAALIPGREDIEPVTPELHIVEYDRDRFEGQSRAGAEAAHIAGIVRKLLDEDPQMKLSDIAVLHRSVNSVSSEFISELTECGLPVICETEREFFESVEVRTVLTLLSLIDNERQDIPLLAVMHSPAGGFTLEEESRIRLSDQLAGYDPGRPYYEAFARYARDGEEALLREKVRVFRERLFKWRERAHLEPVDRFIWELCDESGYYLYIGALPGGRIRQNNLKVLVQRAEEYARVSYKGLSHFLQYIARLRKRQQSLQGPESASAEPDALRLMSIHKSKGLEFKAVILAGAGKKFNLRDSGSSDLLLHKKYGFGTDYLYMSEELAGTEATILKYAVGELQKREALSEEMRLLYVAMTRAEQYLYVVGAVPSSHKLGEITDDMSPQSLSGAGSYLEWLVPAVLRGYPDIPSEDGAAVPSVPQWQARIWTAPEDAESAAVTEKEAAEAVQGISERVSKLLSEGRAAKTPLPAKISVSSLKKQDSEQKPAMPEIIELRPAEEASGRLSGAQVGTLVHGLMEKLDFGKLSAEKNAGGRLSEIERQKSGLLDSGFYTKDEADAVDPVLAADFMESDIGQRLLNACRTDPENVLREYPLLLRTAAEDADSARWTGIRETIEIQGILDCCFYENGAWTLLDYKTDRLSFLSEKDRGERLGEYAVQTAVYARAITELTGVPVREQHVYFLRERLDYRPDTETSAEGMIVPEYQVETAAEIRETAVTD